MDKKDYLIHQRSLTNLQMKKKTKEFKNVHLQKTNNCKMSFIANNVQFGTFIGKSACGYMIKYNILK